MNKRAMILVMLIGLVQSGEVFGESTLLTESEKNLILMSTSPEDRDVVSDFINFNSIQEKDRLIQVLDHLLQDLQSSKPMMTMKPNKD